MSVHRWSVDKAFQFISGTLESGCSYCKLLSDFNQSYWEMQKTSETPSEFVYFALHFDLT